MARYLKHFIDFFNCLQIFDKILAGDLILNFHNTLKRDKEDILRNDI